MVPRILQDKMMIGEWSGSSMSVISHSNMYAMSMWTYHENSGTFLWQKLQGISINYFDKNSGKRHACLPHTRPLSKWVKCEPHDVEALNDLVRWTHGGVKTVTVFFRNPFIIPVHHYQIGQQLWWEQDIASIPREFFAILLSHDDFFYWRWCRAKQWFMYLRLAAESMPSCPKEMGARRNAP